MKLTIQELEKIKCSFIKQQIQKLLNNYYKSFKNIYNEINEI